MPKGSLFLSSSRSRISSNCFSSSNNQKHLIQKPQIGCTPRLPHRNQETNKPETSWQSLHPSTPPPQKKNAQPTNRPPKLVSKPNQPPTPPVASVCLLLRFSNSKRIFSMPGMSAVSFIPNSHGRFIIHVFFRRTEMFFRSFYLDFLFRKTLWTVVSFTKPPNLKKELVDGPVCFFHGSFSVGKTENDPGFP